VGRFRSWYGDGPLHLLALLASVAVAAYAAVRLVPDNPLGITLWFIAAIVGHDLVLFPLYAIADRALPRGRRRAPSGRPQVPWINHVRMPTALSLLLLLVWAPLIFGLTGIYEPITGTPLAGYVERWLAITAALFVLSAVSYAWRLRRAARSRLPG
jgi:hypothetical protein